MDGSAGRALADAGAFNEMDPLAPDTFTRAHAPLTEPRLDRATLVDAQQHPERHRDLVVRVAGCSAYFVQLSDRIQDDIIKRMEHRLA